MQFSTKDKTDRPNTARSTKTNPAINNICPSKLSRRELEDLYFTLTQNNLDLKRVINTQSEKIKVLATKLQRMTNTQKIYLGSETKECCGATKALVQNQKNIIQDLKQSNEVLREQVKQLNMKLCSTKQFLKRPVTVMALTSLQRSKDMHGSAKHRSASALNSRSTTEDLKKEFASVSCQCFASNRSTSALDLRSTTEKPKKDSTSVSCQCPEPELPYVPCDENKCRTLLNELKQEIVSLQEALKTKNDDSDRVNKLEKEIVELRGENSHMKFVKAQQEESMKRILNDNKDIRPKLSEAENRCLDLETSLKIERSKVAELEAKIKAYDICNKTYDKIAERQISKDVNKLRRDTPKAAIDFTRGKTQPKPDMKKTVDIPKKRNVHCCTPQNEPQNPNDPKIRAKKTSEALGHSLNKVQSFLIGKNTGLPENITNKSDLKALKDINNTPKLDPCLNAEKKCLNNESKSNKNLSENTDDIGTLDLNVSTTNMDDNQDPLMKGLEVTSAGPETKISVDPEVSPTNCKRNSQSFQLESKVIEPTQNDKAEQIPYNKMSVSDSKETQLSLNEMNYESKSISKKDVLEKADDSGLTKTNMNNNQDWHILPSGNIIITESRTETRSNPGSLPQNLKLNSQSQLKMIESHEASIAEVKDTHVNGLDIPKSNEFANMPFQESTPHEDTILNTSSIGKDIVDDKKLTSAEPLSRTDTSTPQKLDDSGFADVNKSVDLNNQEKSAMDKNNQLLEKITDMQTQLNNLVKTLLSPNRQNYDFMPVDSKNFAIKHKYGDKNIYPDQTLNQPQKELPMTDDQRSLARTKYTAAKHFQEKENKPSRQEQKPKYFDKTSTPVSSKTKIIRDSITKESQLIPVLDPFFEDGHHINTESLISKAVTTPRSSAKSALMQIDKSHDSFGVEKRVSLKLDPELYDNLSNNRAETETSLNIKHSISEDNQQQTPGETRSSIEKQFRDSLQNQSFNEQSEDHGQSNEGKRHTLKTNTTPEEYIDEHPLQNHELEKTFDFPGTQAARDLLGQAPEPGRENITNTGQYLNRHEATSWKTTDKGQSTRDTLSLKSTLAQLKERLCSKETKTCGRRCLSQYQGGTPEDCPCRSTDGKTAHCSCADVDLGSEEIPKNSTRHRKASAKFLDKAPLQKVLGPLALTDNQNANGTGSSKESMGDLLSPKKTNADELDFADEKEHLNESETKSLNEAWPPRKIKDDTVSLHSEFSGTTSHIQLRLPAKPKALIIEPLAPVGKTGQRKSEQEKAVKDKETFVEPLNICEEYVHICNCPKSTRREVAVFRSCSGTLRFRTVSNAETTLKRCPCSNKNLSNGTREFEGTHMADNDSPDLNKTFTINEATKPKIKPVNHISRSTSPENTDQEISHLTDLPSEKTTPDSTPRDKFRLKSPGECRVTSTGTETGTEYTSSSAPVSNVEPMSLSEGEIPQSSTDFQGNKVASKTPAVQTTLPESITKQVEQSLQTIAEDMVRCRQLLNSTKALQVDAPKPTEAKDNQDSQLSGSNDSKISLHAVSGRSHLQQSPRVMFIMHIGTMVLSDEAVLNYRDLKLVLKWKFYDHNVSMSRVRPGRVVHFDFSTEYDQKLSDDFLNYLKTEELIINVCNVTNLDAPLASCSLPLREALLHTNKRADMSLALVADPNAQRHLVADSIDKGDEMGVLDLWCMLRADVSVLPEINKAITVKHKETNSNSSLKRKSFAGPILDQIVLDDQDGMQEDELSSVAPVQKIAPRDYSHEEFDSTVPIINQQERFSNNFRDAKKFPVYPPLQRSASPTDFRTQHSIAFDPKDLQIRGSATTLGENETISIRNWMAGKEPVTEKDGRHIISDTLKTEKHFSHSHNKPSGILINEVKPNIRNISDMKKALEDRFIANKKVREKTPPKCETGNKARTSLQDIDTGVYEKKLVLPSPVTPIIKMPTLERENRGIRRGSVTENKTEEIEDRSTKSIISDSPVVPTHSDRFYRKSESVSQLLELKRNSKSNTTREDPSNGLSPYDNAQGQSQPKEYPEYLRTQTIDITILWLALNEECQAMQDPNVQKLYVAYSFLGHGGAELETPQSLPKPKQYHDKCYFNFKKRFHLTEPDIVALGHMAHVRSNSRLKPSRMDCVIFDVVSEPVEDPLGLNNCEDIGTAHLYFGDLIAYGAGSNTYTDVLPVRAVVPGDGICGVLAVRVDGLDLIRASARMMEAG